MRGRGLAAGVVVLVAVSGLAACSGDEDRPIAPIDASYALDGKLSCDSDAKDAPTLPLPDAPVAMVICADPDSSLPWTAPIDLVEGDLRDLTRTLAGLEEAPEGDYECTFQGGPGFDLLLRLPDDRAVRVHGDTGGCGVVSTSGREWFGAQDVLDAVLAAVEEQRSRTEPPRRVARVELDCNTGRGLGQPTSLVGDVADLVRLVSCWQPDGKDMPPFPLGTEVRPRGVRFLAADFAESAFESTKQPPMRCHGGLDQLYLQQLVGQTRWGDLLVVYGQCRMFYTQPSAPDRPPLWWIPSPRAQRILDGLRR